MEPSRMIGAGAFSEIGINMSRGIPKFVSRSLSHSSPLPIVVLTSPATPSVYLFARGIRIPHVASFPASQARRADCETIPKGESRGKDSRRSRMRRRAREGWDSRESRWGCKIHERDSKSVITVRASRPLWWSTFAEGREWRENRSELGKKQRITRACRLLLFLQFYPLLAIIIEFLSRQLVAVSPIN